MERCGISWNLLKKCSNTDASGVIIAGASVFSLCIFQEYYSIFCSREVEKVLTVPLMEGL